MTVNTSSTPAVGAINTSAFGKKMKTVLAIDDSPEILMIITETLNHFGFQALVAEDGLTGIKLALDHRPDLIICDVNMPHLDGYATLQRMREHEATSMIPFVFLSGVTDRVTIRRGMELGADDYLTKPFTPSELVAAVNTRLGKQEELQKHSNRKLDELRGNLSMALPHELRTPLNGIMGLAHLMMEDHAAMPPEEVLESARYIHESALRLHRLIENFLVYSQIELLGSESKTIDVATGIQPVVVQDIVPTVARKIAASHKREGDLVLNIQPATLLVPAENLAKIVEEIIDNAFKFSEPGKTVAVSTEELFGHFALTVSDLGRGMGNEQISRIGPHIQFDRQTYEQQGSGLGLFIAKRITELLGGQFLIESKPAQGTSIKISFLMPGI